MTNMTMNRFFYILEPNSSLVTSNIKGPLVGDLFWLYHRLNSLYRNRSWIAKKKEDKYNNSDKVHKCSFKKIK